MGRFSFPRNALSAANSIKTSNMDEWLQTQIDGSGSFCLWGTPRIVQKGINRSTQRAQNWPADRDSCSWRILEINPSRLRIKGGNKAMGRAMHIEAIYIIIPIWIDIFQMTVRFCDNIPSDHRYIPSDHRLTNCNIKGTYLCYGRGELSKFLHRGCRVWE